MVVSPIEEPAGPVTQASPLDRSDFALIREVERNQRRGRNAGFAPTTKSCRGTRTATTRSTTKLRGFAPDNATASQAPAPRTAQIPPAFAPPTPDAYALAGAVDGLDRVVAQALAGAGVTSLRDLVEHDAGSLARATGINFSRIRRCSSSPAARNRRRA
ncbi:MAG: helix-hairpin-helix domain-containing protein [Planctomycetota bacterium]